MPSRIKLLLIVTIAGGGAIASPAAAQHTTALRAVPARTAPVSVAAASGHLRPRSGIKWTAPGARWAVWVR